MIELVKVEVKNFRSFADATFTPLGIGQGLTAINGANGMGKSTIVHAIVWALYGITPDGVRVGALRRQGSEGSGDVEARVTFNFNDETIVVTRGLRGKNDTTIASITLDGVEQTNVSSRTASQWITNHIGLDAEAFLTAFVVRQKELDSLVKARPAERRKVIERLAGIERMSKALDIARSEYRNAQRVVDALPASVDPDEIKSSLDTLTDELETKQKAYAKLNERLAALKKEHEEIASELKTKRQTHQRSQEIRSQMTILENRIEDIKSNIETLKVRASTNIVVEDTLQTIKANDSQIGNLRDAQKAYHQEKAQLSALEHSLAKQQTRVSGLEDTLQSLEAKRKSMKGSMEAEIPHSEESLSGLRSEIDVYKDQLGSLRGESKRLSQAISTIEEHNHVDGAAECPTCNQPLIDPALLLKSLNNLLDNTRSEIASTESALNEASSKLKDAQSENEQHASAINSLNLLISEIETIANQFAEESNALNNIQKELAGLALVASFDIQGNQAEIDELEQANKLLQKSLMEAEAAATAAEELEDAETILHQRLSELSLFQEEMSSVSLDSDTNLAPLEDKMEQLAADIYIDEEQFISSGYEIQSLQEKISSYEAAHITAVKNSDLRKTALADLEIHAAAASSIEEFRRDRLARLTPELSEVATDFVARMTDGKYTSVMLDDEFTPVLTDATGIERPISWLSGGEESAVALALRVAIGEVLAGQKGGLLVLDEVLTAQDSGRRQSTMSAIKTLPRQIITINHVSEATDMVDLVANIVPGDDGASTIEEWAPDTLGGVVTDEILDAN